MHTQQAIYELPLKILTQSITWCQFLYGQRYFGDPRTFSVHFFN